MLAAVVLVAGDQPGSLAVIRDTARELATPLDATPLLWSPSLRALQGDADTPPDAPVLVMLNGQGRVVRASMLGSPDEAAEALRIAVTTNEPRREQTRNQTRNQPGD